MSMGGTEMLIILTRPLYSCSYIELNPLTWSFYGILRKSIIYCRHVPKFTYLITYEHIKSGPPAAISLTVEIHELAPLYLSNSGIIRSSKETEILQDHYK